MGYGIMQAQEDIKSMQTLIQQKNSMLEKYDYIPNSEDEDEIQRTMEKIDEKVSELQQQIESTPDEEEDKIEMLILKQEKYQLQIEIISEYNNIVSDIHELEKKVIASVSNARLVHHASTISPEEVSINNYREIVDNLCLQFYKVPLLVALITNDPSDILREISSVLDLNDIRSEVKNEILQYIEMQKRKIDENLILSDNALIDLIETTTGKNIMSESLQNGRIIEKNNGTGYSAIKQPYPGINRHTYGGSHIVKFMREDNQTKEKFFDRKVSDMFTRDFPNSTSEELIFRSFSSLPDYRKSELIKVILDNLALCYEMFKSYYMNDKIEIPAHIKLTSGEEMDYQFYRHNLPHILGINRITDLPLRTIQALGLDTYEYNEEGIKKDILAKILDRKDAIIRDCGLIKDLTTNTYYELLPWEKIILKTNAFLRGDFFKKPALIAHVNPSTGLFSPKIERISLTGTQFAKTALNQSQPNANALNQLKRKNQETDFIIKGMCYDEEKGMWVPQTNASAMGERIILDNSARVKTLERYRRALENFDPNGGGGMMVSIENEKFAREYTDFELAQALVDISLSFGDSEKIAENVKEVIKQLGGQSSSRGKK